MTERQSPAGLTDDTGNRFLLMARVGSQSMHAGWLEPASKRNFDVLLSAFESGVEPMAGPGVMNEYRPGTKVAGYDAMLREHEDLWRRYDYIAMFDDDIETDAQTIAYMFELCRQHSLKIAQPALTRDSHVSFMGLVQQPRWQLRFTNFVEMMCPIFSRDALVAARPLFGLGRESGIDLVWCSLSGGGERDFAVLDAAPVRHQRPVASSAALNGFVEGRRYADDIRAVLAHCGQPYIHMRSHAAIDSAGRLVTSRLHIAAAGMPLLLASPARAPRLRRLLSSMRYLAGTASGRDLETVVA